MRCRSAEQLQGRSCIVGAANACALVVRLVQLVGTRFDPYVLLLEAVALRLRPHQVAALPLAHRPASTSPAWPGNQMTKTCWMIIVNKQGLLPEKVNYTLTERSLTEVMGTKMMLQVRSNRIAAGITFANASASDQIQYRSGVLDMRMSKRDTVAEEVKRTASNEDYSQAALGPGVSLGAYHVIDGPCSSAAASHHCLGSSLRASYSRPSRTPERLFVPSCFDRSHTPYLHRS